MYCAAFWQRLEKRGVDGISDPVTLATLVYCASVLVNDCSIGPAPTAALWDAMQQAMEGEAQNMNSQEIANVFLAHAYLDVQPEAGVHAALFNALQRKQSYIKPQEAANIAWAVGKLRLQLSQPQEQLLLQLLKQHTSGMVAQGSQQCLARARIPRAAAQRAAISSSARCSRRHDQRDDLARRGKHPVGVCQAGCVSTGPSCSRFAAPRGRRQRRHE